MRSSVTTMRSRNVQVAIDHLFEAFNARDLDRATAAYSSDVVFIQRSRGTTVQGYDDVRAMFERLFASPRRAVAEIDEVIDAGDTVVFSFTMVSTDDAGKTTRTPCLDVVKFDAAGRIAYEDNYSGQSTTEG